MLRVTLPAFDVDGAAEHDRVTAIEITDVAGRPAFDLEPGLPELLGDGFRDLRGRTALGGVGDEDGGHTHSVRSVPPASSVIGGSAAWWATEPGSEHLQPCPA